MGHVFVRLSGYGLLLVSQWPYRFARAGVDGAVQVTTWVAREPRAAVVGPAEASSVDGVVDVADGPDGGDWRIETSRFSVGWPDGFTVESPQDPADGTLFYLFGPGDEMIFPQGPVRAEKVADPDVLVAPGQRVVERRRIGDVEVVELAYEHEGQPWWQAYWLVPVAERQRVLLFTAQAPEVQAALVRVATDQLVGTLR